ncbi:oligosaccharyl transferase, STT3 subunit [Thermococcus eurythermalis]|uniref:dolichyl-phosphooligosaccharide-protein glycotransferase n=1 Tax=Thermococcus eurythermalis TaxID=1505907 RepID=A0A097QSR2_9EURY|nr:STT3 domain-containing protein [Thermococcus eurythermalis]AIU69540.1 oligosaccharyl transferase, STT3 subunit [Thermococcus eurythermalis]
MSERCLLGQKVALGVVVTIALIVRLLSIRFKYLLGYDPYFHLAYIEEVLKAGEWFNFFTIANGPWGFQVKDFHPLGLWMTPAYVYKVLSVFGISLQTAFKITPVIFGVLTVVFLYLALLKLYDIKRAFFASLFLALSFGHIFRSMANYYRGDNYMLFWYSVALSGIALALSADRKEWGFKRFAFYLIPALASGFAAIFWQAYYPIFVFLLANGVFLATGAFILDKKENLLDAFALILSTVLGAVIANFLGGKFGYGMFGYTKGIGKSLATELGVEFGLIKDAYLLVHLYYLVPLSLAFVVLLILLLKFVKDKKARIGIIIGLSTLSFLVIITKFPALRGLFSVFGMFEGVPIMETRPTTFQDLWKAFSISLFLSPLFLLRFRPKHVKAEDFLLLGLIMPSLYLLSIWVRFVSIGSLAIAIMAGVGLAEAHNVVMPRLKDKRAYGAALALLMLLPAINGAFAFKNVLDTKPFMNEAWEDALTWLKDNSNENDIVLAWWDYGTWVTYYSRRSPVAEIAPNSDVALYYLGKRDENWAVSLGVDYVIVSYYDFLKFGAIVETANGHPKYNITEKYGVLVMPLTSSAGALIFQKGGHTIIAKPGERWDVQVNLNGQLIAPKEVYVEYGQKTLKPELSISNSNTYLYINLNYKYAIFMNEETFNTTLAKLFIRPEKPYELVYSDGGLIKVLRLKHPNVRVEKDNGIIIFHFENATGTRLGIWGFLDNGTQVFNKWYDVKGKEEFELPEEVNGTVIRYAYAMDKKVIDRGIFRRG